MKKQYSKEEKKGQLAILYSGFSVAVCLAVVIMALFIGAKDILAWFADNQAVDASGQSVQAQESYSLIVSSSSGGPDVGTMTPDDRLSFSSFPAGNLLRPGATGAYDAYLIYGEGVRNPSYDMFIRCYSDANQDGTSYRDNTIAADQERAMELVQTHIAFFLHYENGVYSDWLEPGRSLSINCTEPSVAQEEQHVTIYWMWVENYGDLLPEATSAIAATDRARMLTHAEENPEQWFLDYDAQNDTTALRSNGYNGADTFLATVMNSVCFSADFVVP